MQGHIIQYRKISYGTDGWVYELNVDLDKLSGYALDFGKLYMSVNGVVVNDFKVDGSAKPTSPVAVTAGGKTYTFTATINGKEYTAIYKVTGTETSKESPSLVGTPSYGAGFGVANKYGGDWSAAAPVLDGMFNIFEVDTNTMKYDSVKMSRDIENYGLFTYKDFENIIPEYAYEAFNGNYLKVAIGKGLITWDDILKLAERYGIYF